MKRRTDRKARPKHLQSPELAAIHGGAIEEAAIVVAEIGTELTSRTSSNITLKRG